MPKSQQAQIGKSRRGKYKMSAKYQQSCQRGLTAAGPVAGLDSVARTKFVGGVVTDREAIN
jgi:hypothetical protein